MHIISILSADSVTIDTLILSFISARLKNNKRYNKKESVRRNRTYDNDNGNCHKFVHCQEYKTPVPDLCTVIMLTQHLVTPAPPL